MSAVTTAGTIFAAVGLYVLYLNYLHRLRFGRCTRDLLGPNRIRLRTDTGTYVLNGEDRKFEISGSRSLTRVIPFEQLMGVKFRAVEKHALIEESLRGFDAWDLASIWRDRYKWYAIVLVTKSYEEITLFRAGQYEPREPIMIGIQLEQVFAKILGVRRADNFDVFCRVTYEQVMSDLRKVGVDAKAI